MAEWQQLIKWKRFWLLMELVLILLSWQGLLHQMFQFLRFSNSILLLHLSYTYQMELTDSYHCCLSCVRYDYVRYINFAVKQLTLQDTSYLWRWLHWNFVKKVRYKESRVPWVTLYTRKMWKQCLMFLVTNQCLSVWKLCLCMWT